MLQRNLSFGWLQFSVVTGNGNTPHALVRISRKSMWKYILGIGLRKMFLLLVGSGNWDDRLLLRHFIVLDTSKTMKISSLCEIQNVYNFVFSFPVQ